MNFSKMNIQYLSSNKAPKYDVYEINGKEEDITSNYNYSATGHQTRNKTSVSRNNESTDRRSREQPRIYPMFHSTPMGDGLPNVTAPSFTSISKYSTFSGDSLAKESASSSFKRPFPVVGDYSSDTIPDKLLKTYSHNKQADTASSSRSSSYRRTSNHLSSGQKTNSYSTPRRASNSGRSTPSCMTPSSVRNNYLLPSTIVAIVEGRGQARREIGIAAVDLQRPLLTLIQFSDTHTYTRAITKLALLNPAEVLFASTTEGERLMTVVRESMEGVSISTIQRKYFNDARGLAIIKHLSVPQCAHLERQISSKYYCLSATAALIRYVEQIQNMNFVSRSLIIKVATSELTLMIDHISSKNLELVRNLSKGWEQSLLGAIRYTSTHSGTRMLRASLLQPFADITIIEARLSALEYLSLHPELFHTLKSILGRFPDLDWILSMCVQRHKEDTEQRCEQRLNYVIGLKNTLELLHPLQMAFEGVNEPIFNSVKESISGAEVEELLSILEKVIHEDARLVKGATAMRTQRCYAIKSNINGLLDVARKIYSEIIDDITGHVTALAENYGLETKFGHNTSRGFHVIIPVTKKTPKPQLPECFIQVQYGRGSITCTTEEIYQMDQRSRETLKEIMIMSNVIILHLMDEIRDRLGSLYGVAEAIASLDMVVGLTHAASLRGWIRPEFSSTLAIIGGRHAILDLLATTPPIPNNTMLNDEKRAMIITGPNMSGKSTYLRQVALIQVLAQIGSFVPADMATLKLVDHMFTSFGSEDNPENNASTFQVQMNEVSVALEMSGRRSIIILDELGQNTNLEEGTSLAWAIIESFLLSNAFLLLATHIKQLTWLPKLYPHVTNYYMESVIKDGKELHVSHILRKGITDVTNYGLSLAEYTTLPKELILDAYKIAEKMGSISKFNNSPRVMRKSIDDAVYTLAHQLLAFVAAMPSASLLPSEILEQNKDSTCHNSISIKDEESLRMKLKQLLEDFLSEQNKIVNS